MSRIDLPQVLVEHRRGGAIFDFNDAVKEALEGVRMTGKPAKVSLEITFTPSRKGPNPERVDVSDKIGLKLPTPDNEKSVFFLTESNELSREDPYQEKMEFEVVREARPMPQTARESDRKPLDFSMRRANDGDNE
jgi:hypothetical protein